MTVCIVGNSHAGSLRLAYEALPDKANLQWDFFVAPNGYADAEGLRAIAYDAKRHAFLDFPYFSAAKGADLEIADYDCFVLVGAHHSAAHMVAMFPFDVSAGFRARAVQEICQKSRLFDFAQKIRAVSAVRILLVTKPAPTTIQRPGPQDIAAVQAVIETFWAKIRVEVLPQPAATMTAGGLTRADCFKSNANQHFTPEASAVAVDALRQVLIAPH